MARSSETRKAPTYCVLGNGFILPNGYKAENFNSARTYAPQDNDIFIVTYPKCGTTWTQNILLLMKNRGRPLEPRQNINQFIPHIERVGGRAFFNMEPVVPRKKTPYYYIHENGFIMPGGFKPENFYSAQAYVPKDSDIFIVTYPKCGTTWNQCILYLMKNKGIPLEPGQKIDQFIPHIEEVGKEEIEAHAEPRIIKTHLPYRFTPKSDKAKYICIARNPKDCCVSYYHHTKGFVKHYKFEDGTFDDFFELFLEGHVDFGDYFDHLLSWFEHKDDPNVLFLLYEEMKEDTVGSIKRIGEFLGGDFQKNVEDPSILEKIVAHSSFEKMKATPSMWSSERPKKYEAFIRKGKVGDWRTHFSEEQSKRLDEKFKVKLAGTKAANLWENFDC